MNFHDFVRLITPGAITYTTGARDAIANAVADLVDGGAAAGRLLIGTSGMGSTLATLTFAATAFGSSSNGVATAASITSDTNASAGTMAAAEMRQTTADALHLTLGVATSGAEINFAGGVVTLSGDTVAVSALTITAPT